MLRAEAARAAYPDAAAGLDGLVVLVVGATGALGSAVARAAGAAGATAVLLGRRVAALEALYDELLNAGAPRPAIYPLDLAGALPRDYATLAQTLVAELGRLDAVVWAAAAFDHLAPTAQRDPDVWLRDLHVNLAAPWLLLRACLPALKAASAGAVVIALEDASRPRRAFWGAYGTGKAGLSAMTDALAAEFQATGPMIHAVAPAAMASALRDRAFAPSPDRPALAASAVAAAVIDLIRPGTGRREPTCVVWPGDAGPVKIAAGLS